MATNTYYKKPTQITVGERVCVHNDNVLCGGENCGKCGWNPAVAKRRVNKYLRRKRGNGKKS